ncbi:UPD-GlcNAc transporter [Paecilomyces variotii No. 5]|uniref:UPD-GlcNAc transporter n=1 Tax=Byssochlamys spectabilis (strain No. 5 / NBRC 109023) TaxID=1356009 RepID=V5FKS4_BYSSN|nr:UPD-GlcNAc transporter [Paecilomyces variotii No. 5]
MVRPSKHMKGRSISSSLESNGNPAVQRTVSWSRQENGMRHRKDALDDTSEDLSEIAAAAAQSTFPAWTNMVAMTVLIFGGCCANVYALEGIIKDEPSAGPLITLTQFVTVALFTLPSFIDFSAGPQSLFIAPRAIPLRSWVIYTAFFVTVNLLNNWAFAYRISVPLHIILRSAGPVASMIIGYIYNAKRYSAGQIFAVVLLSLGVSGAALADAEAKGKVQSTGSESSLAEFLVGFLILVLAMILSAFQGVYADRLYETYGRNHWREALLYSHMLSLPVFLPTYPQISSQLRALVASPPVQSLISPSTLNISPQDQPIATTVLMTVSRVPLLGRMPVKLAYLALNAVTQYVCIRGVHLLSAKSSSLTVTIVLNIRKLVSLLLSIYLFGNRLAPGVMAGAAVVFAGAGLYGFEGARLRGGGKKRT